MEYGDAGCIGTDPAGAAARVAGGRVVEATVAAPGHEGKAAMGRHCLLTAFRLKSCRWQYAGRVPELGLRRRGAEPVTWELMGFSRLQCGDAPQMSTAPDAATYVYLLKCLRP